MEDIPTSASLVPSSPRRALSDLTNLPSPRGGKRPGAGRPSSAERNERFVTARQAGNEHQERRQWMVSEHASLANPKGRALTSGERRIALSLLLALQAHEGKSLTDAVNSVSQWLHTSNKTLHSLWQGWNETKQVGDADNSRRGAASAIYPHPSHGITPDQQIAVQDALFEAQQQGKHCSSRMIHNLLKTKHQLSVCSRTVRRWLRKLGYRWGKSKAVGRMTKDARAERVRTFIQQYAAALKKQEAEECVIVYTDESFVHTGHHSRSMWFLPTSEEKNEVRRKTGRGKRLILLHAMTQSGLLRKEGHHASNTVSEPALNAELIFEGLNVDEDYHKSVNGDVFISWVENRLIPAFKAVYHRKKMVLVLDNAPYHHARPAGWRNPNRMNKMEIASWMVDQGLKDLKVMRDGAERTFGLASLFAPRSGQYAPTLLEMKEAMKKHLKDYPEKNRTRLQEVFVKHGYELIFTPPYTPQTQPIELVWAHVKNYVARQTDAHSNVASLQGLVRQGFYGDAAGHQACDASLCSRLIGSCHKWMNKFIENDDDLNGTVDDLVIAKDGDVDLFDDVDEGEEEEELIATSESEEEEEEVESDEE
jgi:hypothetical protein